MEKPRTTSYFYNGIMNISIMRFLTVALAGVLFTACADRIGEPREDGGARNGGGKEGAAPLSCTVFAGTSYCALGGASLAQSGVLTVTGMGAAGDGVAIPVVGAGGWSQRADIDFPDGGGGSVRFTALDGGGFLGALTIARSGPGGSFELVPSFSGGGGYAINVFLNGNRVGGEDAIDANADPCRMVVVGGLAVGIIMPDNIGGIIVVDDTRMLFTDESPGGLFSVTLPNGTAVTGNRITITGSLAPGSPHTIQEVDVQGVLDGYIIKADSAAT
jgi:hypothetical protein